MKYTQLLLCLLLIAQAGIAQISGPSTGTVGVPVTFSTTEAGSDYNWAFNTTGPIIINPSNFNPTAKNLGNLGNTPAGTSMVFDGTNWYSFSSGIYGGQIIRASFGNDPTSMPTLTPLGISLSSFTGNRAKSINVVYDSTAGRWFGIVCIKDEPGLTLLDFGATGLNNLTPTMTVIPTTPSVNQADGLITVVRDNGAWHCVVSSYQSSGWTYYNLGASLGTLSASTPVTRVSLGAAAPLQYTYYTLYKEGQEWFSIASDVSNLYRFEFGTSLQNTPTIVPLPGHGGGTIRGIMLVSGCDNQLYGYTLSSGVTVKKLDFSGSIKNTPTYTTLTTSGFWGGDPGSSISPFAYNDTLYAAVSAFSTNALYMVRLMPLTGSATLHYNNSVTKTFTAPGTYDINLFVDPGRLQRQAAHCTQITISPGGPAQPGLFTAAPPTVCAGQTNVTYTVPAVSGATSYEWLYTGTGATFSGTATTATPTNNVSFSGAATSGTLRVRAVNGSNNSTYRDTAITINVLPVQPGAFTASSSSVCQGQNGVTFTVPAVTGATSYEWSYTGTGATFSGTASTMTPTNNINFSTSATTGNVEVRARNSCSTSSTRSTSVTVNTLPTVSITGNSAVCGNATLTLTGSPASGVWSSGTPTAATVDQAGLVTGVATAGGSTLITYSFTNANNCTGTATKTVTVNAIPPVPNPISGNSRVCMGDSILLTNTTTGGLWSSGTPSVATISGAGWVKSVSTGSSTITYRVANANNCSNAISTNIAVNPLPPAPAAITGATSVCVNAETTLASVTTGGMWSSNDANTCSINASSGMAGGKMPGATTIKYTITDGNGCSNFVTRNMIVNSNPSASITPAGTIYICDGNAITLTAAPTGAAYTYKWMKLMTPAPIGTAGTHDVIFAGYYNVIVTDSNGCTDTSAIDTVIVNPLPSPTVSLNGQIISTDLPYTSYQWYANAVMINGATQRSYTITKDGNYYVVVTDANGCSNASDTVTTVAVPIVNHREDNIGIYPNPANTMVHIMSPVAVNVQIWSTDGKMIIKQHETMAIDISSLPNGVYMLRIMDRNGAFIKAERLLKATGY